MPFLASLLATWAIRRQLPTPDNTTSLVLTIAALMLAGVAVAILVERLTRRWLPLASLLELSLAFPDRAPSRYSVALRAGSAKQLAKQAADIRSNKFADDSSQAAEQVLTMVEALRHHEPRTRGHTERVRAYCELIAEEMGLSTTDRSLLQWGVLLHDIGKLAVPAELLSKNGAPTAEEWDVIRTHPAVGAEMVEPLANWLGPWRHGAGQHHERWDGTGYPNQLEAEEISLAGRIVAVADAYDVITSARSYKEPMSAEAARRELVRCSGTHFDPAVVRAMLDVSVGSLLSPAARLGWVAQLPALFRPAATTVATAAGLAAVAIGAVVLPATAADPSPAEPPVDIAFAQPEPTTAPTPRPTVAPTQTPVAATPTLPAAGARTTPVPAEPTPTPSPTPGPEVVLFLPTATAIPLGDTTPTPTAIATPVATATPAPATTPTATTPIPTATPRPAATPMPTATPLPTATPMPTATPVPLTDCERAVAGDTVLIGGDLSQCDLSGLSLDGVDLSGADLTSANLASLRLSNFSLDGATLTSANLAGAVFQSGSMDGANIASLQAAGVRLTDVNMTNLTGSGANFAGAFFDQVGLQGSNIPNTNFANGEFYGATFDDSTLSGSNFFGAMLEWDTFRRSIMVGVTFDDAKMAFVGLEDADVSQSTFLGTALTTATLWNTVFDLAEFTNTDFTGANGVPAAHATGIYLNVSCPDTSLRSSTCW